MISEMGLKYLKVRFSIAENKEMSKDSLGNRYMKNIITMCLALTLIISCGKKTQSTQSKISFLGASAMTGGGSIMGGGIIVVGHRIDESEKFTIALNNANDEQTLDLQKGDWEFAAIGWEGGSGPFTGTNRCGYSGIINLNSAETAINFTMNYATCAGIPGHGEVFSPSSFMHLGALAEPNQFMNIALKSCNSLTITGFRPTACNGVGLTGSVKVIAVGSQDGSMGSHPLPSLEGSCQTPLDANGSLSTDLKIPVGNYINGKVENLMKTSILAYQSFDCTGTPIEYRFNDSMFVGINQPNLKAAVDFSGPNTILFLEHNATTVSANIGTGPFGFGMDGDTALVPQVAAEYGRIKGIYSTPEIDIAVGSGIQVNDEIMWYVNSQSGNVNCGDFLRGMYGFAQVKNINVGAVITLGLDHSLTSYPLTLGGVAPLLPPVFPACSMQVVRVRQYRNIILTAASNLTVLAFNPANNTGGLFPFKVSNLLDLTGGSLTISADGAGFTGASDISDCTAALGYRCLKMAGGTNLGGGIVLSWINQLHSTGLPHVLTIGATGTGGDGGQIQTKIGDAYFPLASPVINQDVSGNIPGFQNVQYCTFNGQVQGPCNY